MKHIGIFNTSGDVQTAIENEALLNPYVAKVSGALDYNSVVPTPVPTTMGTWAEDTNSFTILENDYQTYWSEPPVYIGQFNGVYLVDGEEQSEPQPVNMNLYLYYDGVGLNFTLRYDYDPSRFDTPSNGFNLGVAGRDYFEHTYIDPEESNGNIQIDWDGVDTFTFSGGIYGTLSVTKHNPEYPSAEESEASE